MKKKQLLAGLAGTALLGLVACGGGSNPNAPEGALDGVGGDSVSGFRVSDSAPPVSAEEACPPGLETETVGGVTACVHSNDFVGNCVTPDVIAGRSELVLKMGFLNPDGPLLYNKPAIYHTYKATCSPPMDFHGQASEYVTGFPIAPGNNGIATWTLPLSGRACGTYTILDTVRDGEGVLFMPLHQSVNTGRDCEMTCQDLKLTLDAEEISINKKGGHKIEFTATWEGKGTAAVLYKKANRKKFETSTVSPFVQRFTYSAKTFAAGETATLEVTKKDKSLTCSVDFTVG